MQLLTLITPLHEFFQSNEFNNGPCKDINIFLNAYRDNKMSKRILLSARKACGNNNFFGAKQQDSQEFLTLLLDNIEEELKKHNHHNVIDELFGINSLTKLYYPNKKTTSKHQERMLSLALPDDVPYNMRECYELYCRPEEIGEGVFKRNVIEGWPLYLFIHIKKYDNMMRKINDPVDLPLKWNIENVYKNRDGETNTKRLHKYRMMGFIIHYGGYGGGHYVNCSYRDGEFYMCSDTTITEMTKEQYVQASKHAYLVLYGLKNV